MGLVKILENPNLQTDLKHGAKFPALFQLRVREGLLRQNLFRGLNAVVEDEGRLHLAQAPAS